MNLIKIYKLIFYTSKTKKIAQDLGKLIGISNYFFNILIFTTTHIQSFAQLLRLTASSYDIIDGFELLPPIVHFFILSTNFYTIKYILIHETL